MHISNTNKLRVIADDHGTPTYVYDLNKVRDQFNKLDSSITWDNKKIFYAIKANWHPQILATLRAQGCGAECVSKGEVRHALENDYSAKDIIFTGSGQSEEDLLWIAEKGVQINVDSLHQLSVIAKSKKTNKVSLRLNNDVGEGHHNHVVTGGSKSKFGIHHSQIDEAIKIANEYSLTINGLHQHIGSHILEEHIFVGAMAVMYEIAGKFNDLEFIDFGGSFGVPYRPGVNELDMKKLGDLITNSFKDFCNNYGKDLFLYFEPGRYLVAEAGTLLVKVTDIKEHPYRKFVLVNSGFNHLIRPAMYDSYHHITNISNRANGKVKATIGGNVCESGDIFGLDREIDDPKINDILAIHTVGAYGFSMSSQYNLHELPKEICME